MSRARATAVVNETDDRLDAELTKPGHRRVAAAPVDLGERLPADAFP